MKVDELKKKMCLKYVIYFKNNLFTPQVGSYSGCCPVYLLKIGKVNVNAAHTHYISTTTPQVGE